MLLRKHLERFTDEWGLTLGSPSRFAVREGTRVSAMSKCCARSPTFRKRDFATKAPRRPATRDHRASDSCGDGVDGASFTGGASLGARATRETRGSRSCPRAESGRRSQRDIRTRVHSLMEGARVRESTSRSRVCGETGLGDWMESPKRKRRRDDSETTRASEVWSKRAHGWKITPPRRCSIRRSKSGP